LTGNSIYPALENFAILLDGKQNISGVGELRKYFCECDPAFLYLDRTRYGFMRLFDKTKTRVENWERPGDGTVRKKINSYKALVFLTSSLFLYLFFSLMFDSSAFVEDLGLQPSQTTSILARRASVLMLGFSVLLITSINLPHSRARQRILLSAGITMAGFACMGAYELVRGTVNMSILQAIVIESILGFSFFVMFFKNWSSEIAKSYENASRRELSLEQGVGNGKNHQ